MTAILVHTHARTHVRVLGPYDRVVWENLIFWIEYQVGVYIYASIILRMSLSRRIIQIHTRTLGVFSSVKKLPPFPFPAFHSEVVFSCDEKLPPTVPTYECIRNTKCGC